MSNPWGIAPNEFLALDHSNRTGEMIGTAVLLMVIATTIVALRLYTRCCVMNQVWLDDYMAVAGLLFYIGTVIYNISLLLIKFSLFFQYYRLIQDIQRYRFVYLGIMGLVVGWTTAQIFVIIFMCSPVSGLWDGGGLDRCLSVSQVVWMNALGNIFTDIVVLLLPMPVVWKLNFKLGTKWAVIGVFSLGFLTCIISMCRLIWYTKLSDDFSYDTAPVATWGLAELTSGLVCSGLITLRPLLRLWFPKLRRASREPTNTPKFYTFGCTNPFSRHTPKKEGEPKTHGDEQPFDGSETELTRLDEMDSEDQRASKVKIRDFSASMRKSSHSMTPSNPGERRRSESSDKMPDHRLNLVSGVRTVISTGDYVRDPCRSPTGTLRATPSGILVEQAWSIRKKDSKPQELDPLATTRSI